MNDTPRAFDAVPRPESDPDLTVERGFIASLRWLVEEGDARGVRRIAVELRALREALTAHDETRAARDEFERRAQELDKELQATLAVLGPGTATNGNGSLVQRLARLRERLAEGSVASSPLSAMRGAPCARCSLRRASVCMNSSRRPKPGAARRMAHSTQCRHARWNSARYTTMPHEMRRPFVLS